jgi:hypothetical protein
LGLNQLKNLSRVLVFLLIPLVFVGASFYSFSDAAKKIAGKDREAIIAFLSFLKKVVLLTEYDPKAKEFHDYLEKSVSRFEFSDLYNSKYMKQAASGEKYLVYSGEYTKKAYRISLLDKEFSEVGISKFGDFATRLSLKKNEFSSVKEGSYSKSNSYTGELKARTVFGKVSHETGLVLMEELLKVVDPQNVEKIAELPTKAYKELKGQDERKLVGILERDFPKFLKYINFYTKATKAAQIISHNGKKITRIDIQGTINKRTVQRDFPYLAEYLEDVLDLGWLHFEIRNTDGAKLLDLHLNSKTLEMKFLCFTTQGKVIPFTVKEKTEILLDTKAIELSKLNNFPFQVKVDFYGNIYGLKFENPEILFHCNFQKKADTGILKAELRSIAPTKVSGGFSYLIPSWLIDIFIPGNMEEIVNHFFQVLVKANDGEGSFISLQWDREKTIWFFHTEARSEFLDNFFIRFGLRVWNHKIWPAESARKNLAQAVGRGIDLFIDDYPK